MKKLFYLFIAGGTILAACNNSPSYKITGTAQDIPNGDTVYIQEYTNGELIKVDSAIVNDGKFVFTGKQDSTVARYITFMKGDKRYFTDFFLQNGDIKVVLGSESSISGTKDNDTYQDFKNKFITLNNEMKALYMQAQKDTANGDKIMAEIEKKDSIGMQMVYNTIYDNMDNAVGIYMLPQYADAFDLKQQSALLAKVPTKYASNPQIMKIKARIEVAEKTAVGEKYINFSMKTPEGNTVQLSDFISQNKYTLVDFWASWCGPCRAEMPVVVAAYNEFKSKGFSVVGVSLDEKLENWKEGIASLGITWPQMSDLQGWNSEGARLYGVNSIPATVLISQDGVIVARNLRGDELKNKLTELFQEATPQQ